MNEPLIIRDENQEREFMDRLDRRGVSAALKTLQKSLDVWGRRSFGSDEYNAHRAAVMALGVLITPPGLRDDG